MLAKLMAGWRKDSLVKLAFADSNVMLRKAQLLFVSVADLFLEGKAIEFDIYPVDKEINRGEIAVRRKVLEHLSINPRQDLVFSLVLTTIISDIERIGDYAKNIYELSLIYEPCHAMPPFTDTLKKATEIVKEMFDSTLVAFEKEDPARAEQVMASHVTVNRDCERTIRELAAADISAREAVTLVLYARFLKRVSAHLANVMSSVIKPFDHIGYYTDQLPGAGQGEKEIDG